MIIFLYANLFSFLLKRFSYCFCFRWNTNEAWELPFLFHGWKQHWVLAQSLILYKISSSVGYWFVWYHTTKKVTIWKNLQLNCNKNHYSLLAWANQQVLVMFLGLWAAFYVATWMISGTRSLSFIQHTQFHYCFYLVKHWLLSQI